MAEGFPMQLGMECGHPHHRGLFSAYFLMGVPDIVFVAAEGSSYGLHIHAAHAMVQHYATKDAGLAGGISGQ